MKTVLKSTHGLMTFAALAALVGGLMAPMAISVVAVAQTSAAQSMSAKSIVDQAKADQIVGERIDGYLALVDGSAPANVQAAVSEINIRRKSVYTKLAQAQGVAVTIVARLSGEKLIAKAKPGTKTMGDNGVWATH